MSTKNQQSEPAKKKKWHEFSQDRTLVTPRSSVITLFVMGTIFLLLAALFLYLSTNNSEYSVRYDQICDGQSNCLVTFNITKNISGNIALLYRLNSYYQNHRRIVDSISYPQLRGSFEQYQTLTTCSPRISKGNSKLVEDIYVPCGLLSFSFFNDSYIPFENSPFAAFTEYNISLSSDREFFQPFHEKYKDSIQWLDNYTDFPGSNMNEHFIVWVRTAAMPILMKLYMKCENCTIPKGEYQIQVRMNYPKSMFPGERWLIISETGPIGSGSLFIFVAYISAGSIGLIFAICFLFHMLICPRRFGDLSMLWPTNDTGQIGVRVNQQTDSIQDLLPAVNSSDDDDEYDDLSQVLSETQSASLEMNAIDEGENQ